MELVRIPTKELDKVWGLIEKDIKQALLYSGQLTDSDFVLETAKQNKFQIWVLWDKTQKKAVEKYFGVVVTEIITKKLGKVCHIYIMTGRQRHKWQYLISEIEKLVGKKSTYYSAIERDDKNIPPSILLKVFSLTKKDNVTSFESGTGNYELIILDTIENGNSDLSNKSL